MALNYVDLTCDLQDGQGTQVSEGTASFTPTVQLTDAGTGITTQAPVTAVFRKGIVPVVQLLATDNSGPLPAGWGWTVTFTGVPGSPASFSFFLPYADGADQDLSSQAPVYDATTMQAYLPLPSGTAAEGDVPVATGSGSATQWSASTGDKTYDQSFSVTDTVDVAHNLGKYPAVTVMDTTGDQVEGDILFIDLNNLTVSFSAPFSGTVTCN
jgi:hypothetical protein